MTSSRPGLVLFFTYGVSLKTWAERGLLDREVELYRWLRPHFSPLSFVTYGGGEDLSYASQLDGIQVLYNRWGLSSFWMSLLAPLLYREHIRKAAIFKTNQLRGAWAGVVAKALFRKKLVVRGGYLWSVFRDHEVKGAFGNWLVQVVEQLVLHAADRVVVTSERMREDAVSRYGVPHERFRVIPNYVNTEVFGPDGGEREKGLVCFAGRLSPQKNLPSLIEALRGLPGARLRVIGAGEEMNALREHASTAKVPVEFSGSVPNRQLPRLLNRSELFVLPSFYEGNPKTLLEAMACGLPIVASDVEGIRDIVRHGETGYLCGTDTASLREAIRLLLGDAGLRQRLGDNARWQMLQSNSTDVILRQELEVLTEVLGTL